MHSRHVILASSSQSHEAQRSPAAVDVGFRDHEWWAGPETDTLDNLVACVVFIGPLVATERVVAMHGNRGIR